MENNNQQNIEYCPACGFKRATDDYKCPECSSHQPAQDFPPDFVRNHKENSEPINPMKG